MANNIDIENQVEETEVLADTTVAEEQGEVKVESKASVIAKKVLAALKEKVRKTIVKLKRKTHIIPLLVTMISSLAFLCFIGPFAEFIENNSGIEAVGLCTFVNTLASILILPLFLYAFPKRSKPKVVFLAAVGVVFALIIGMDVLFLVKMSSFFEQHTLAKDSLYLNAHQLLIVHLVLVGISVVVYATLPLYKMGLNKINTRKVLDENDFSGEIDTSAEV